MISERAIVTESGVRSECFKVDCLVIGSGAAGLNAAVQLRTHGIEDVLIVTEGLDKGTSINTGSDKQTYYKLGMIGSQPDSPRDTAEALFNGGSMNGDLALVEASLSPRAFFHLVNLGVPFPRDEYGQFVGYKTDHDPRQRATSVGPYTSREMCRRLIDRINLLGIPFKEFRLAVSLLTVREDDRLRAAGAIVLDTAENRFETYLADNVLFAVGGPGGLYRTSVYPGVHTGAVGLALMAGAKARNLPESQFGMSSIRFRWNVSGSYMQVIPRFFSTGSDGVSDPREFLRGAFDSSGEMNSLVFLKGYQWPFDAAKAVDGSSLIDLLVYIETVEKGRRVFLDYRVNSKDFSVADLSDEAREYLERSGAVEGAPLDRLKAMNPAAIELYRSNGIDLAKEPLEIAVCAQHNNGGLAADKWWRSENIDNFYPLGEVNGSHGVTRPGGSALNSGQVGGFRAAEHIAGRGSKTGLDSDEAKLRARESLDRLNDWLERCPESETDWAETLDELQDRMSRSCAHVRSRTGLTEAVRDAETQWRAVEDRGLSFHPDEIDRALTVRQLCFSHLVYLKACLAAVESGQGSRGSALVLGEDGQNHPRLGDRWKIAPEDTSFRNRVLETTADPDGNVVSRWTDRRPLPETDAWFETAWADFKEGRIYNR